MPEAGERLVRREIRSPRSPLGQTLGDERMFPNLQRALGAYLEQTDITRETHQ